MKLGYYERALKISYVEKIWFQEKFEKKFCEKSKINNIIAFYDKLNIFFAEKILRISK